MENDRERAVLAELCAGGAALHGWDSSVSLDWHLDVAAVRFIFDHVRPAARTLETGCGYSTIAFALAGAHHTAVSPFAEEHGRIRRWCEAREVDLGEVEFVVACSQDALPGLGDDPLEFVLVDGDHAFPIPFVDYYYAAARLRPGGLCMIDDIQIRTGGLLHDHLRSDSSRWRLHTRFPTTVVYERLGGDLLPAEGWMVQPFTRRVLWRPIARRRVITMRTQAVPRLRNAVRLRTRLRAWRGRNP